MKGLREQTSGGLRSVIRDGARSKRITGDHGANAKPHDFIVELRHGDGKLKPVIRTSRFRADEEYSDHLVTLKAAPLTGVRLKDWTGKVVREATKDGEATKSRKYAKDYRKRKAKS